VKRRYSAAEAAKILLEDPDTVADICVESDVQCSTLMEAANIAESDNRSVDIVILPPSTVDSVSDEEVADDDELLPSSLPSDVAGPLVVQFHEDSFEDCEVLSGEKQKYVKQRKSQKPPAPKWRDRCDYQDPIDTQEITNLSESHPYLASKNPFELFRMFYDDELQRLIINESITYARQKNDQQFNLNETDLDTFIAILMFSGYHSLPRERLYWSRDEDVEIKFVNSKMSRNRFECTKRYLHLANNDLVDTSDKLYKIRPFVTQVNAKLQQFGLFSKFLSIDEEMVPYFGHHLAKMFIRSKPIRFGYKLRVLASDTGYPYHFSIYCGKTTDHSNEQFKEQGLGFRVVTSLLSIVSNPKCHEVFFDNFFTSYELLAHLKSLEVKATGTVRENRLKQCPLQDTKLMKKTTRGAFDTKCDGIVGVVKWHNNQCVTVATNYDSIDTVGKVKRWSTANKKVIEVPQPTVVNSYNCHMGCVDLLDSFMANYRPTFDQKNGGGRCS
jgi:hypothetical protein